MQTLKLLRTQIDEIDIQIKQLLDKRFDLSLAVGNAKKQSGIAVLDQAREQQIISAIEGDKTLRHNYQIAEVYRTIMSESKKLQK